MSQAPVGARIACLLFGLLLCCGRNASATYVFVRLSARVPFPRVLIKLDIRLRIRACSYVPCGRVVSTGISQGMLTCIFTQLLHRSLISTAQKATSLIYSESSSFVTTYQHIPFSHFFFVGLSRGFVVSSSC
jgi:hypothetical protein